MPSRAFWAPSWALGAGARLSSAQPLPTNGPSLWWHPSPSCGTGAPALMAGLFGRLAFSGVQIVGSRGLLGPKREPPPPSRTERRALAPSSPVPARKGEGMAFAAFDFPAVRKSEC